MPKDGYARLRAPLMRDGRAIRASAKGFAALWRERVRFFLIDGKEKMIKKTGGKYLRMRLQKGMAVCYP